jgi:type IV pilus assembly protein PilC
MKFSYSAINKDGQKYTAILEAADKAAFYTEFKKIGDTLVSVQDDNKKGVAGVLAFRIKIFERVKMIDKITFARNLGNMLEAGLSLSRAISVAERQTTNPKLKDTYVSLNQAISGGKSFHEAMEMHPKIFSNLFVAMVKVGEEGGNLQRKIKGAMMYPSVIITVMIVIAILMMMFVVPGLTKTFRDLKVPLPTSTKIVIGISDFCSNHYFAVVGILIAIALCIYAFGKTTFGRKVIDYSVLRLPVIGTIIKEGSSAQVARTLASLLQSGVDLLLAVKICGDVMQNSLYKEVLKKCEGVVEKGEALSSVFTQESTLFPIFVGEMMSVGEETGRMSAMLVGVANFYENEVDQKTKDLSTIIEPVLMVFIGASVGFFAISMIKPIYSVMDNVK